MARRQYPKLDIKMLVAQDERLIANAQYLPQYCSVGCRGGQRDVWTRGRFSRFLGTMQTCLHGV